MQPTYYAQPVYVQPVIPYNTPNHSVYPYQGTLNQTTPYISLSAVPYTGLDLGPIGEVVYWSILALLSMAASMFQYQEFISCPALPLDSMPMSSSMLTSAGSAL